MLTRVLAKQKGVEEAEINLDEISMERDDLFLAVVNNDNDMTLLYLVQVKQLFNVIR